MFSIPHLCKNFCDIRKEQAQMNNRAIENNTHEEVVEGMNDANDDDDDDDSDERIPPGADSRLPPAYGKRQRTG